MKKFKQCWVNFELIADERLSNFKKKKNGLNKFIKEYNKFIINNKNLFKDCREIKKEEIREIFWKKEEENDDESHYQYRLKVYFCNSEIISKRRLIDLISKIYESCDFACAYYQ